MKKSSSHKNWNTKDKIVVTVFLMMMMYLCRGVFKAITIRCVDTQCAPARVYAITKVFCSHHSDYLYKYFFIYNNKRYEGHTPYEYAIGDTIMVNYWPKFPQINSQKRE